MGGASCRSARTYDAATFSGIGPDLEPKKGPPAWAQEVWDAVPPPSEPSDSLSFSSFDVPGAQHDGVQSPVDMQQLLKVECADFYISPEEVAGRGTWTYLGGGAFGVVYRATWSGSTVAVKLLRGSVLHDSTKAAKSWIRELQALRRANEATTRACVLLGVTYLEHSPSLVMRFYGGTLSAAIQEGLDGESVLRYSLQMCGGLAALHANDIIMQDLKPANCLIDDQIGIVLSDFGLASLVDQSASDHRGGSPQYMSPEQYSCDTLTPACDMWAFAVCVLEMATGRPPWHNLNVLQIAAKLARFESPLDSLDRPPLLPSLEGLVSRCLLFTPSDRPTARAASLLLTQEL